MIDHMTLTVRNLPASVDFYKRALAPLGYRVVMDFKKFAGFGDAHKPYFWLKSGPTPTQPMHIAFKAGSRAMVDAFHAAALEAGGKDNGSPGLREHYHPSYYGAFAIDPDGHPIEAVCHQPSSPAKRKAPARKKTAAAAARAKGKSKAKRPRGR